MRIIEVIPSLEDEASGPSYSVPRLAKALSELGNSVQLMSVGGQAAGLEISVAQSRYAHDLGNIPVVRKLLLSRAMRSNLRAQMANVDLIHAHGLWVMPNVYPAWAAHEAGKPCVISPRGTLGVVPLTYSPRIKRIFWRLFQGAAVRQAACLHATSQQEYQEIRNYGLRQPTAIIPNGIDIPPLRLVTPARTILRLLYLGRLHPKKGLEALLTAWSSIAGRFPDWELRLVGTGPANYTRSLMDLCRQLELKRVTFAGPRHGAQKAEEYAAADLFILPSLNENFGMTVAEALAQSIPVITTTGTPWQRLHEHRCGWWVNPDVEGIEAALAEGLATSPEQLDLMGQNGRAWMSRDFSWCQIGLEMQAVYRWIVQGGAVPQTVRLG